METLQRPGGPERTAEGSRPTLENSGENDCEPPSWTREGAVARISAAAVTKHGSKCHKPDLSPSVKLLSKDSAQVARKCDALLRMIGGFKSPFPAFRFKGQYGQKFWFLVF
jgi:hypothetical protein